MQEHPTEAIKTVISAVNCVAEEIHASADAKCIGFLLVAELFDADGGTRTLHVISGEPDGTCLNEVIGHAYIEAAQMAYGMVEDCL